MSDPQQFWFHCGRCGALFQSKAGDLNDRLCSKCGFDPATGVMEAPQETRPETPTADAETPDAANPAIAADAAALRAKRTGKRRKNQFFMLKLVGGWTLVLALIVVGARYYWHEDETPPSTQKSTATAAPAGDSQEDLALLNEGGPKCNEAFSFFLSAGTPEERNQFVLTPISTASRMVRFYSLNPLTSLDPATLSLTQRSVLDLPGGKAIETQWKSQDGKILDAVFRQENGDWRLDWEHFARFSDYPLSLFLAGSGEPEGEFRLLARERLAEERKDLDTISVVFYAPRFGHPRDAGFQSPEFLVSRNKPEGKLLDAAFKLARSHQQVFGSQLPVLNPDGMIRVKVKLKRTEVEMERRFELTAVTACHWYSVAQPGLDPDSKPAETKPAPPGN